jgi:hypothetical protein
MGRAMSWESKPNGTGMIRDIRSWVQEVYTDYRNRGLDAPICREQAALNFGVKPRRIRQVLEGDVISITQEAWQDMRRRFLLHLENEAAYAMQRAAQRTAQIKEMERQRAELRELR